MAIKTYTTVRDTNGEVTLSLREQRTILNVLTYAIKNNPDITRWSDEVNLYNDLSEAYKKQLENLAADIEYHLQYDTPKETAQDMIAERKESKGEAA